MFASLKKLLSPPQFENDELTHQAYLLHVILWGLLLVPIPYVFYEVLFHPEGALRALIQGAIAEAVNVTLMVLLRRGYVRSASIAQVTAFWLFFTVSAFTDEGVHGEAYLLGYPLVIVTVGILLGGTAAFSVTVLSLISGLFMVDAYNRGMIEINPQSSSLSTWMLSLAIFPMSATMQYLASRTVKKALERARLSEEKYRLISRVSSDYTFESSVDEDGVASLIWVAGAFEKMTGYTYDDYIANGGWIAHIHPDDREKDARDIHTLMRNEDVIRSEIRTFAKNGEIRWERIFAHPVWDEKQNRLVGIVGAVQDVTMQKEAEEMLKETLLRQTAILNNIPDAAWMKDKDGRYIAVNEQFFKIVPVAGNEIAGKTDFDISPEPLATNYRAGDLEVITSKQRKVFEQQITDQKNNELWLEVVKTPIFNSAGEVVGTTGIARDITGRKQAELDELHRREMLEKVIELGKYVTEADDLRATIKKIWRGIHDELGFDRLAVFLYNPELNRMDDTLGTDNNGQMVDNYHIWFPIDEGSMFTKILKRPDGYYFTHNYAEENNIPPNHEMSAVKDYIAVAAWAGSKPVAVICADHAITQRPIPAERLEALRLFAGYAGLAIENARLHEALQIELAQRKSFIEELEAKNTELERFTYTVSHDLKSPLVTITGFLSYLEKDARNGNFDKFNKDIERIQQAVQKMQNLLKDLLELSRIGRLMNEPAEVKFGEIIKEALALVEGQIAKRHVSVEFVDDGHIVRGDAPRLIEAMQNLIDNAVKFMGDQPHPQVRIGSIIDSQNRPTFFVQDNGIGIDPQYVDRIFGLFNKLDANSQGSGVGLTIVKRIIEVHGGKIWVESQPGKGSTFYFNLNHDASSPSLS